MVKSYLKMMWRGMKGNKMFSFINIFGLAIGFTSCLLIAFYIYHESSYDKHQKFGDRLYQLVTVSAIEGEEKKYSTTPAPMAPAMKQEFPEIESYTRIMKLFQDDKTLFQYKKGNDINSFYESLGFLADSTYFRLFTYHFKEGDGQNALNEPNSVVLSEETATKIFGKESALNKIVHINSNTNGSNDFRVTGVFIPSTTPSHINAKFFISMNSGDMVNWLKNMTNMVNNNMFYSYLLLKPDSDPGKLEKKFEAFIEKHAGAELKASGRTRKQILTLVPDIHLYGSTEGNVTPDGSLVYLKILFSIALITLLIACVNFMNLSTAKSSKRAIEIGVRKVMGAEKKSLIGQFITEAIFFSVLAFFVAIAMSMFLMPLFRQVSGKELEFSTQQYTGLFLLFLAIALVTGVIAGLYPAFYLSAFKPITVLKGKFSNSFGAISFRKVLVVFQFIISAALIVASLIIGKQMTYMRTKDLGFQKDQQIIIPLRTSTAKGIYSSFKNSLANNSAISNVGASEYYPGIVNFRDWLLYRQGTPADQTKQVFINVVDESFLQTLAIKPVQGRLFSKDFPADTANRIILNEEAIKDFGFASAEDAIGKTVNADWGDGEVKFPVIGVVKDFHFQGLHDGIKSYGFLLNSSTDYDYMVAHVQSGKIKEALQSISASWTKLNPDEPFEYSFLDQDFQKNYIAEERLASIIRYFTIIAILISCLGLFGLTAFSVEQRTKEIGIRKVLGAPVSTLVGLLSKDFLKLVALAVIIATPLAWWFMNKWIQNFVYRTDITWLIFAESALLVVFIAFFTISFQAIKAAFSNPVKNLRTE